MSAQIEIPSFLLEMSKQMHEQDNRCTAEPIFQVRCKRYLVTAADYNEHHWEIIDDEGSTLYHSEVCDKQWLAEWLVDYESDWCSKWFIEQCEDEQCDESDGVVFAFCDLFDVEDNYDELPDSLMKIHLQETEEIVKTCLTVADANWFIQRKQHDYPKLYTYAASMYQCPQMIELRNWIMSLTTTEVKA
jgi:hypothetical protein